MRLWIRTRSLRELTCGRSSKRIAINAEDVLRYRLTSELLGTSLSDIARCTQVAHEIARRCKPISHGARRDPFAATAALIRHAINDANTQARRTGKTARRVC